MRAVKLTIPAALLAAMILAGCVTPVIPIPPPIFELERQDLTQTVVVKSGQASGQHANALIYFLNLTTGEGVITQADEYGKYRSAALKAIEGQQLELWAARFADDSPSSIICFVLDQKSPTGWNDCH